MVVKLVSLKSLNKSILGRKKAAQDGQKEKSMRKEIRTWRWGNNSTNDEYTTTRGWVIGNYNDSIEALNKLVTEAVKDFPKLEPKDINLGKTKGTGYMDGHLCISFLLPENTSHSEYNEKGSNFNW